MGTKEKATKNDGCSQYFSAEDIDSSKHEELESSWEDTWRHSKNKAP